MSYSRPPCRPKATASMPFFRLTEFALRANSKDWLQPTSCRPSMRILSLGFCEAKPQEWVTAGLLPAQSNGLHTVFGFSPSLCAAFSNSGGENHANFLHTGSFTARFLHFCRPIPRQPAASGGFLRHQSTQRHTKGRDRKRFHSFVFLGVPLW
jgi:hypothetical protein